MSAPVLGLLVESDCSELIHLPKIQPPKSEYRRPTEGLNHAINKKGGAAG
jgi:hypothetical protein